jgi:ornithine cyclodeaminase/alanine dehydrogenase-like protein (mu-crystallin family)
MEHAVARLVLASRVLGVLATVWIVLSWSQVRVWSRGWEHACAFAERHRDRFQCDVVPVREPNDAAACDIVCTVRSMARMSSVKLSRY